MTSTGEPSTEPADGPPRDQQEFLMFSIGTESPRSIMDLTKNEMAFVGEAIEAEVVRRHRSQQQKFQDCREIFRGCPNQDGLLAAMRAHCAGENS